MPTLFHFGNSTASGGLRVECLQPSLEISGKFCVSSSCSGPSCSVQVSSRTCQQSTQTFTSGGSMLDGGSLASHSSQHAGRCSSVVPSCKRSHCGCFGRPGTQGSAISAFNPLALSNKCYADKASLPHSVRQWGGNLNIYIMGLPAVAGRSALDGALNRVYQTMPSSPKLANFCYICFRWDWHGIPLVSIILLFLHFWSLFAFTRNLIILSFQN